MMQATQEAAVRSSEQETRQMYEEIGNAHLFPFWARSSDIEHDEIRQLMQGQRAVPYVWRYKEVLEPLLQQSARLISTADSDRRSLGGFNRSLQH